MSNSISWDKLPPTDLSSSNSEDLFSFVYCKISNIFLCFLKSTNSISWSFVFAIFNCCCSSFSLDSLFNFSKISSNVLELISDESLFDSTLIRSWSAIIGPIS